MKTNYSQNVPSHLQMYETQEQVTSSDGTELRLVTYDYTSTPTVNDNDGSFLFERKRRERERERTEW